MQVQLFILFLSFASSSVLSLKCETCRGESCYEKEIPLTECNRNVIGLPFNFVRKELNLEASEYRCLRLEYSSNEGFQYPVRQCFLSEDEKDACQEIADSLPPTLTLSNCEIFIDNEDKHIVKRSIIPVWSILASDTKADSTDTTVTATTDSISDSTTTPVNEPETTVTEPESTTNTKAESTTVTGQESTTNASGEDKTESTTNTTEEDNTTTEAPGGDGSNGISCLTPSVVVVLMTFSFQKFLF